MNYDFEDRINRVINNHQFTCQHRSHYLFVLRGFEPLLKNITINVLPFASDGLSTGTNYWISFEEAFDLNSDVWNDLKINNYDIWIVNFNFFDDSYFALSNSNAHLSSVRSSNIKWVKYKDNSNLLERKSLNIFNTNNALTGIVSDNSIHLTNEQRLELLPIST